MDDLTGPWQLLVDDYLVASRTNATILRSSNMVSWAAFTNLINTNGTAQVTDTPPANQPPLLYRPQTP